MSRLDSAIRRLQAQRACLDEAARLVATRPGPVLEIGLGNGRTYHHLCEICPHREIFVFDRQVASHPDSTPDPDHLFLGDFRDTLSAAARRLAGRAVLAHADTGTGDRAETAALAAWLGPALAPLLAPGAVVASDQLLAIPGARPLLLPDGIAEGRYFLIQMPG